MAAGATNCRSGRGDTLPSIPNCPRYIPNLRFVEPSVYAPRLGVEPLEPKWKSFADFKDFVHPRQPTATGSEQC
jgi:hypothetical protein